MAVGVERVALKLHKQLNMPSPWQPPDCGDRLTTSLIALRSKVCVKTLSFVCVPPVAIS